MKNRQTSLCQPRNPMVTAQSDTVYLRRPDFSVAEVRSDPTAECRWWNSLTDEQRTALVHGAKTTRDNACNDWLDIGETNRLRILDAAYAVECWISTDDSDA
ncbi:MAG: hypothetical protein ACWGPN_15705 [Gammaproteobacteria bacterium]